MTPSKEVVVAFMDRINQRDPDQQAEMMTDDHVFVDSLGKTVKVRQAMREGWRGYYAFCPDYWVSREQVLADFAQVAVFGAAGGTIAGHSWRIQAAWLAVVENNLVKEWRVYADNKPVYDILAQAKGTTHG